MSKIEWTEKTWNPVTGCSIVTEGCRNCYAMREAHRINNFKTTRKYIGTVRQTQKGPKWTGRIKVHKDLFDWPKTIQKPTVIFVNSMSDLFHETIRLQVIREIFQTMNDTPRHTYQILTKRAERLPAVAPELNWTENVWLGVSVEHDRPKIMERIEYLKQTPAKTKFISFEPLIGEIQASRLDLKGIDWAIVGGESGPNARPIEIEWVDEIKQACDRDKVIFNFKQWGGRNKKVTGRTYQGRIWDGMPPIAYQQPNLFEEFTA